MHLLGFLTLIVLVLTVTANIIAHITGITLRIKKLILIFWIVALVLMFVA